MKNSLKRRLLSLLLAVAMVAGSIGVWQIKQDAREVQATDIDETTGYRELTFEHFGLKDGSQTGATNQQDYKEHSITEWDGVAVSGYVAFNTSDVGSYLGFGVTSTTFVAIRYNTTGVLLGGAGMSVSEGNVYSGAEVVAGEKVYIRLTFDVDGTALKVTLKVKEAEAVSATYTIEQDAVYGMRVYTKTTADTIAYESIKEPYTEISFNDFGLEDGTYNAKQDRTLVGLSSFDHVAFTGTFTFGQFGGDSPSTDNVIVFGAPVGIDVWTGIRIFLHSNENGKLFVNNYLSDVTVEGGNPICSLAPSEVEGITSLVGAEIQIRMTFDYDATSTDAVSVQVSFEVNGQTITKDAKTLTGAEAALASTSGYGMLVKPNGTISISSVVSEVDMDDVAYDIEKEPYLLTSYHDATVTKNGESVDVADCILEETGDYQVITKHSGATATRNVSLYILGDVDLSESTVGEEGTITLNAKDIKALKNILSGSVTATLAQQKAADLNNDGEITNTDLKLLQDIVAGNVTRDELVKKYYPASVTYNYLGSDTEDSSEVMPIAGYRGPSGTNLTNEEFEKIAATGINMINYLPNENYTTPSAVLKELEYAENNNLGIFVTDSNLKPWSVDEEDSTVTSCTQVTDAAELSKLIGRYSYFDSYLGNFLVDEPIVDETSTNAQALNYYKDLATALNGYANMEGYLNVAAGVWFDSNVTSALKSDEITTYEEEVKYIAENTGVNVLSFDRYLRDTETVASCPRFMLNMDIIRNQAQESEIPFWAYVPAGVAGSNGNTPTEEEVYWQTNVSLAYGAKGIQYFKLYTSDTEQNAGIMNGDATTNWYTVVTEANKQIQSVDEILMKATNLGVYATGGYALANTQQIEYWDADANQSENKSVKAAYDLEKLAEDFGVKRVASITTDSEEYGALVGVFDYRGKIALYVVNYDTTSARNITVNFDSASNYKANNYRVMDANQDVTGCAESYTQNVAPGEAFLIIIEEEEVGTTWQEFDSVADIQKFQNADGTYSAPELDGYVFSGWYGEKQVEDVIPDTYKRYTFANWGLTDNYVENNNKIDSTKTPITSWNNVAVHGYVSYTAGGRIVFDTAGTVGEGAQVFYSATEKKIGLGGRGVSMFSDASETSSNPVYSNAELTEGEEVYIRVLFSEESDGVLKITLYVNEAEPVCGYFKGTSQCSVRIQGTADGHKVEYRSAYEEMSFSDWGLTDNYVENNNKIDSTKTPITSWNNVAVHGYVSYTAGGRIVFDTAGTVGAGAQVFYSATEKKIGLGGRGVDMFSDASETKSNPIYSNAELTEGEEVYIRVLFSEESDGVLKITLYVNEAEPVCGYFKGTSQCSVRIEGTTAGHKVEYRSWQPEGIPEVAITDLANHTGKLWARYVDESVLSVRAQIKENTSTNTADIRFLTTVDSLDYEEVGFMIQPQGLEESKKDATTVYREIFAIGKGSTEVDDNYYPTIFSAESKYFCAYSYWSIKASNYDKTFTVTPYWITLDGTTVYGETAVKSVSMGINR